MLEFIPIFFQRYHGSIWLMHFTIAKIKYTHEVVDELQELEQINEENLRVMK